MLNKFAIITCAALTCGLTGCASISDAYRDADSTTYKAIAPEYRRYVENDAALDADEKQRRFNTLDSWELRLRIHAR